MRLSKRQKIAVLVRARDLLARRGGWIQGGWYEDRVVRGETITAHCLDGACNAAYNELFAATKGRLPLTTSLVGQAVSLYDLVARKTGGRMTSVPEFNDRSSTRKKDILALIDTKIEELS